MQGSDGTAVLIWDEMVDSDRMCRYYGYLMQRADRLGDLLQAGAGVAALGGLAALLPPLPEWLALACGAVVGCAALAVAARRYAVRSAEIFRQLQRVHLEWKHLWNGARSRPDADMVAAARALSERQGAIIDRAPRELPLSRSLACRSQREAREYWRGVSAEAAAEPAPPSAPEVAAPPPAREGSFSRGHYGPG